MQTNWEPGTIVPPTIVSSTIFTFPGCESNQTNSCRWPRGKGLNRAAANWEEHLLFPREESPRNQRPSSRSLFAYCSVCLQAIPFRTKVTVLLAGVFCDLPVSFLAPWSLRVLRLRMPRRRFWWFPFQHLCEYLCFCYKCTLPSFNTSWQKHLWVWFS